MTTQYDIMYVLQDQCFVLLGPDARFHYFLFSPRVSNDTGLIHRCSVDEI